MSTTGSSLFPMGSIVFARLKGFPPWPARVVENLDPTTNPTKLRKQQFVRFYKTDDVAWVPIQELSSFAEKVDDIRKSSLVKTGKLYNDLRVAVDLAEQDLMEGGGGEVAGDVHHHGGAPMEAEDGGAATGSLIDSRSTNSFVVSQKPLEQSQQNDEPTSSLVIDQEPSSLAKLAPVPAMQELNTAPSSSRASQSSRRGAAAAAPNVSGTPQQQQRITLTINKGDVQSSSGAGGVSTRRGEKRGVGATATAVAPITPTKQANTAVENTASSSKRNKGVGGRGGTAAADGVVISSGSVGGGVLQQAAAANVGGSGAYSNRTASSSNFVGDLYPTGMTLRYGFYGLSSDAVLLPVVEKMANDKNIRVNVYMPASFEQQHKVRQGAFRQVKEAASFEQLFSESEVVFLTAPTENNIRALFEGDETHHLRRCVKAGGPTRAVVMLGVFDPFYVKHVTDLMAGKQIEVLELAPIGVSAASATHGDIVFCASGNRDVTKQIGDFFNAAGKTIMNLGTTIGSAVKLASLFATFEAMTTAALVEVLHDANHLDVNPTRLLELIATQSAASMSCTEQAHLCVTEPLQFDRVRNITRSMDDRLNIMRRMLAPMRAQEFMLSQTHAVIRNIFAACRPELGFASTLQQQPSEQSQQKNRAGTGAAPTPQPPTAAATMPTASSSSRSHRAKTAATTTTAETQPTQQSQQPKAPPVHKHGTRAATNGNGGAVKNEGGAEIANGSSTASSSNVSSAGTKTGRRGRPPRRSTNSQDVLGGTAQASDASGVAAEEGADSGIDAAAIQAALRGEIYDMTKMAGVGAGAGNDDALAKSEPSDNEKLTSGAGGASGNDDMAVDGLDKQQQQHDGDTKAPRQLSAASDKDDLANQHATTGGSMPTGPGELHIGRDTVTGEPNAKRHRSTRSARNPTNSGGAFGVDGTNVGGDMNGGTNTGGAGGLLRSPVIGTEDHHPAKASLGTTDTTATTKHRSNTNGSTTSEHSTNKTMREPHEQRVGGSGRHNSSSHSHVAHDAGAEPV